MAALRVAATGLGQRAVLANVTVWAMGHHDRAPASTQAGLSSTAHVARTRAGSATPTAASGERMSFKAAASSVFKAKTERS